MSYVSSVSAGAADPFLYGGSYNAADVSWLTLQGTEYQLGRIPEIESRTVETSALEIKYTDLTSIDLAPVREGFSDKQLLSIRAQAIRILRSHPQTINFCSVTDEQLTTLLLNPLFALCSFAWQHHRPREVTRICKNESFKVLDLIHETQEERARIVAAGGSVVHYRASFRALDEGVFATIPFSNCHNGGTKTFKLLFALLRKDQIEEGRKVGVFEVQLKGLLKVSKKNMKMSWDRRTREETLQDFIKRRRIGFLEELEADKGRFAKGRLPAFLDSGRNSLLVAKKYARAPQTGGHVLEAIVDVMPYTLHPGSLCYLFNDLDEVSTAKRFFELSTQLVISLKELFDRGILHNDLKPENIFLDVTPDGELNIHVADFGLVMKLGDSKNLTNHYFGTPSYFPKGIRKSIFTDMYGIGATMAASFIPILDKKIKAGTEASKIAHLYEIKQGITEFAKYLKSFARPGVVPSQESDHYVQLMLHKLHEIFEGFLRPQEPDLF